MARRGSLCCGGPIRGFLTLFLLTSLLGLSLLWPAKLLIQFVLNAGVQRAKLLKPSAPQSTWNRMVRNDRPGSPPDLISLYVFNITNLQAVRNGERPILDELGPYVYRKWRIKEEVTFDRAGLCSFKEYHWFDPYTPPPANNTNATAPMSSPHPSGGQKEYRCADDDVIVTLNMPLLGVLRTVDSDVRRFRAIVELAIKQFFRSRKDTFDGLFMRRTVSELVFGYEDELLAHLAHLLPSLRSKSFIALVPNMTSEAVALARQANVMDTGLNAPQAEWTYVEWEGKPNITCWNEGHVEYVAGSSDALQFKSNLTRNDSVEIFVPQLFRSAKLNVTGTMDANGVSLFKYQPDDKLAQPDPRFFTEISGLMNITACTAVGPLGDAAAATGPPVFMSFPHFCHVDPIVAEQTIGTHCVPEKHDLWLGIEPITGITMAAAKRLQVASAFDGRYPEIDRGLKPTILPIFWAEEAAEVDAATAALFTSRVYPALEAIRILSLTEVYIVCSSVAAFCVFALLVVNLTMPGEPAPTALERGDSASSSISFTRRRNGASLNEAAPAGGLSEPLLGFSHAHNGDLSSAERPSHGLRAIDEKWYGGPSDDGPEALSQDAEDRRAWVANWSFVSGPLTEGEGESGSIQVSHSQRVEGSQEAGRHGSADADVDGLVNRSLRAVQVRAREDERGGDEVASERGSGRGGLLGLLRPRRSAGSDARGRVSEHGVNSARERVLEQTPKLGVDQAREGPGAASAIEPVSGLAVGSHHVSADIGWLTAGESEDD